MITFPKNEITIVLCPLIPFRDGDKYIYDRKIKFELYNSCFDITIDWNIVECYEQEKFNSVRRGERIIYRYNDKILAGNRELWIFASAIIKEQITGESKEDAANLISRYIIERNKDMIEQFFPTYFKENF